MRQAPGPSTRIDLTGAMFSMAAPSPAPVTITPHLVALIYCPPRERPGRVRGRVPPHARPRRTEPTDDDQVARNVSPFTRRARQVHVPARARRAEFPDYGQVFAHCRIDRGPWLVVPFTLLPPV